MDLEKHIKIYDNLINLKTLSVFLKYINTVEFEDATVGESGQINKSIRNTFAKGLCNLSESLSDVHWHNFLTHNFLRFFLEYQKNYKDCPMDKLECIQILKYEQGGFYVEHTDHFSGRPRTLSGIYFLNNDYEGGDLIFNLDNKDYKIEKKPNRFIVWPSNFLYPHRVTPVTKGVRYSVVTWIL